MSFSSRFAQRILAALVVLMAVAVLYVLVTMLRAPSPMPSSTRLDTTRAVLDVR